MQTITGKQVLDNELPESGWEKFCIYVFRDKDMGIYSPALNQQINPHPRALLSKYSSKRDANVCCI